MTFLGQLEAHEHLVLQMMAQARPKGALQVLDCPLYLRGDLDIGRRARTQGSHYTLSNTNDNKTKFAHPPQQQKKIVNDMRT